MKTRIEIATKRNILCQIPSGLHNLKIKRMKYSGLVLMLIFSATVSKSQNLHFGIFGGLANYQGDLVDKYYPKHQTNGSIGVTVHYELTDKILVRGAFTFARVNGADRYSADDSLKARNLSFETPISEISLVGEYYFLNLYEHRFSPYVFAGIAGFHFNPYSYNQKGSQVYLRDLSTEGQGLPAYPDKKTYSLNQFAVPFGGGLRYALSDNIRIGLELGIRKLFTDYLDDVSTTYPAEADLLAAKGPDAVDLSYRGDELQGGNQLFPSGSQRGGAKYNDMYYFTGLNISLRFGSKSSGNRYNNKRGVGCPANPM